MNARKIKEIKPEEINDFIDVYKVFRLPPYSEAWTDEMITEEYFVLIKYGHVFGYYIDDRCVGIITCRKMFVSDGHPVLYEHPDEIAYLADIAVKKEFRGQGIGTELTKYVLDVLKKDGYKRVYMKTLEVGKSMSYGIVIKLGFKLLEGVNSIDTMERLDPNRSEKDFKIYLDKEL